MLGSASSRGCSCFEYDSDGNKARDILSTWYESISHGNGQLYILFLSNSSVSVRAESRYNTLLFKKNNLQTNP